MTRVLRPMFTAQPTLSPAPVQVTDFTWYAEDRQFVAEISSIGGRFGRVWGDSCDVGLTLISRYPGRAGIVFVVNHEERDREGDTMWWDLVPVNARPGFTLRVFNN